MGVHTIKGFPRWRSSKEPTSQCRRPNIHEFDPWVGMIPQRRAWQPVPIFLPGESQWTEEPGGLQSTGSHIVGHDWSDLALTIKFVDRRVRIISIINMTVIKCILKQISMKRLPLWINKLVKKIFQGTHCRKARMGVVQDRCVESWVLLICIFQTLSLPPMVSSSWCSSDLAEVGRVPFLYPLPFCLLQHLH